MKKKLLPLALASALIALAVPAFAQGSELVANGVPLKVGEEVVATSEGPMIHKTSLGELSCSSIVVNGHVTENKGPFYSQIAEDKTTRSGCQLNYEYLKFGPFLISSSGQESGPETGVGVVKGSYGVAGPYTGAVVVRYKSGSNLLNGAEGPPFGGGGPFTGGLFSGYIEVRFRLTLKNGTPVQVIK